MEVTYYLDDAGITFYAEGIVVFDCPLERIRQKPEIALQAMKLLREIYEKE